MNWIDEIRKRLAITNGSSLARLMFPWYDLGRAINEIETLRDVLMNVDELMQDNEPSAERTAVKDALRAHRERMEHLKELEKP